MAKLTCPTCNGAGKIKDLTKTEESLKYPPDVGILEGRPTKPRVLPTDGFPELSCRQCQGQGWISTN